MTTEDVRVRLLAACDEAYQRALAQSARGVRAGILKARQAIFDLDTDHDVWRWFEHVLAELEHVRAGVRDDEDGFELGGIATVRLAVEELRSRMGYIPDEDAEDAEDAEV
ncbi:MAG TPA: hypothetical protein VM261_30055 [Kofleriaceae bacterium]|nr:hypothetical protein [Kofleriaceae bacterium]